jgi:hypothetical protein
MTTNIITPTQTGDIADGAVTEAKLANTINISKFINDAGYVTGASVNTETLLPFVISITGYVEAGSARNTQNAFIDSGDATTETNQYEINGGNA